MGGRKNSASAGNQKTLSSPNKKYCEPFVGGGAVLFDVLQKCRPEKVLVNDVNEELINTYLQIKSDCNLLIEQLSKLQQDYKSQSLEKTKFFFMKNAFATTN